MKLLVDENKTKPHLLSAKEKSELYGIEISALNQWHKAYIMKDTVLSAKKDSIVDLKGNGFDVISKKDMTNWICLYKKSNSKEADNLYKNLDLASKSYNLKVSNPLKV